MTQKAKKVVFVISTGGHVRVQVEVAARLQRSGIAESSILNFPGNVGFDLSQFEGAEEVQEFVRLGSEMLPREEAEECLKRIHGPNLLRARFDRISRFCLRTLSAPLNIFAIYSVFILRALANSCAWLAQPQKFPKPSLREDFLKQVFLESFELLSSLPKCLPSLKNSRFGSLSLYFSYKLFFGLGSLAEENGCLIRFFTGYRPDLIVLPEQNPGYMHAMLTAWARSTGTPLLVLPYTIAGRQEWATHFKKDPGCQVKGGLKRLLSRAFPGWVYTFDGKRLILPLPWMFPSEQLRCAPSLPWVTNSGPDGLYAVDNLFTKKFYESEGVNTANWQIVGSLAEDRLFKAHQNRDVIQKELAQRLGLNPGLPFIMVALPPDQFDTVAGGDIEFGDYRALVNFMITATVDAAAGQFNVVINLHPRTRREDVAFIQESSARIADGPIESLLPGAHLYISVASATIRWAIASEVPVINYDLYRYGYRDYHGRKGVVDVNTSESFKQQLALIIDNTAYHDRLLQAQAADSARLFRFDGKSEQRILGLMATLCNGSEMSNKNSPFELRAGEIIGAV